MRVVGAGGNPAGTDAMNQLRRVLMPCGTTGCTALVEKFAAAKHRPTRLPARPWAQAMAAQGS
eukprot:2968578-Prymnesium_polylepis.1